MGDIHESTGPSWRRFVSWVQLGNGWLSPHRSILFVFWITVPAHPVFSAVVVSRFDCAFGVQAAVVDGGFGQTNGVGLVSTNWAAVDRGATNVAPDEPVGIGAKSRASVRQQSRLVGAQSNLQLVASCWLDLRGELSDGAAGFAGASTSNQTTLHFSIDSPCLLRLRSIFNDATAIGGGFTLFSNLNPLVSADWQGIYTNGVVAATNWRPCFIALSPGNYRLFVHASGVLGVNVPGAFDLGASYQFELLLVDSRNVLAAAQRLKISRAKNQYGYYLRSDEVAITWPVGALRHDLIRITKSSLSSPWMFVTNVSLSDGIEMTTQIRTSDYPLSLFFLYRSNF
jgi:hypothetical protein